MAFFAVLTVGGRLLALLVATWVIGIVRKRDRQIRQAAALLEQRNQELDAFAGRVAHDLRGPLTAISLSTLRLSDQLPKKRARSPYFNGESRMDALIRDLLALSRVGVEETARVANTRVIASTLEDELISKVDSANGRLWIDLEPAEVHCSEVLLRQALWNLGENAVKYRRSDAKLEIGIQGRKVGHSYTSFACPTMERECRRKMRPTYSIRSSGHRPPAPPPARDSGCLSSSE